MITIYWKVPPLVADPACVDSVKLAPGVSVETNRPLVRTINAAVAFVGIANTKLLAATAGCVTMVVVAAEKVNDPVMRGSRFDSV